MRRFVLSCVCVIAFASSSEASSITFSAAGADAAAISTVVNSFRAAIGGGSVAGPNGSFGGVRREINWDGVPEALSDPNPLPGNFFNVTSPRGVVFSTPGTGFLVSANAGGATPTLFGFSSDFQTFSPQKLFTAVNSNITDINFFLPGTTTATTTNAFGVVFTDVEVAGSTKVQFFDVNNLLVFTADALVAGNQGLSFIGAVLTEGGISRVRITSGTNTIIADGTLGNPNDDVVAMDDFIFGEPGAPVAAPVPEPTTVMLIGGGLVAVVRRRQRFEKARHS